MALIEKHTLVLLNDVLLDSWKHPGLITQVSVELSTDHSSEANISVYDPEFRFTDSHLDSTGVKKSSVKIWIGAGEFITTAHDQTRRTLASNRSPSDEPTTLPPLFQGMLTRHSWSNNIATFTFYDLSNKMKQRKHSRYHNKTTDLNLLRKLAKEHDLDFVINGNVPDSAEHDVILQFQQTDWQLAREAARRSGLRLYTNGNKLYAQEAGRTGAVVASLTYKGDNGDFVMLRGFSLTYKLPENKRGRQGRVEVRARGRAGSRISGVDGSEAERGTQSYVTEDLPTRTQREARRRARSRRYNQRESAFEHRIKLLPQFLENSIPLFQGDTVLLNNIGALYSGKYIVREAVYTLGPSEFSCELTLKRDIAGVRRRRRNRNEPQGRTTRR
ncbi:MAG TPA: hypothetical protein VF543_22340 [Pyrinomonadaceae bacterium]